MELFAHQYRLQELEGCGDFATRLARRQPHCSMELSKRRFGLWYLMKKLTPRRATQAANGFPN
ncbi:hypothetical protein HO173_007349 [Letharia columbiana]|uniref:Uncharacterized protein n=1 Tax=Letharia columbiana TaxID=112416 RepID=A0A8H6FT58_9LECA|nr:uncharacterized protein HO173_007349 [Letharia columbiana]KAF6234316.1 hypothetical protein HO173_007349 [Letharia columbiana]